MLTFLIISPALRVAASEPTPLVFSTFYFPGWQVRLDDGQVLEPYPLSDFGLLAVDLPAGEYQLSVTWGATLAQRWGQAISEISEFGSFSQILLCGASVSRWPDAKVKASVDG